MANKQRGELSLIAGQDRFVLRITTNAVCELEDLFGRTFDQVLTGIDRGSMKDVRLFFWAALRDHHPDLATENPDAMKAIGTFIDSVGGITGVQKTITTLLEANAPPTEQEDAPPKAKRPPDAQAKAGTGTGSTPTH